MQACLADIVTATGGKLLAGAPGAPVTGVFTDTRGGKCLGQLFFALKGERYDGHQFVAAAIAAGAAGVVISAPAAAANTGAVAVVLVRDTLVALGELARWWRDRLRIPIVGVTGSSGKTTTKEMLATICATKMKVSQSRGNYNNYIGLPLSLLATNTSAAVGILEMGSNAPGEIAHLTAIARPTMGIITNIGDAHIGKLGSRTGIYAEKTALFRGIATDGTIAVNGDDPALRTFPFRGEKVTFGMDPAATVTALGVRLGNAGIDFDLKIANAVAPCHLPAIGAYNVMNALGAAALASRLGFDVQEVATALSAYRPPPQRMGLLRLHNGAFVLDDTYNANPEAMKRALEALRDATISRQAFAVLGDMLELGEQAPRLHREVGAYAASLGLSGLFLRGSHASDYAAGALAAGLAAKSIVVFTSAPEAAQALYATTGAGDGILVKGSRAANMEEIVVSLGKIAATEKAP